MDDRYLVEKNDLVDIASSIRSKTGIDEGLEIKEMKPAIDSIKVAQPPIPLVASELGKTYTSDIGFSPVSVEVPSFPVGDIENVVDGKWVCPKDWDDVETITLPEEETEQVLYLVFRTDYEISFISWGINSGAYKYTKGHVVDGEFVPISDSVSKNSGAYIQELLTNDFETSGKNTVVFKIEPQNSTIKLTGTRQINWTYNGITYQSNTQNIVMRYGQLYYATQIGGNSYFLECDNIRNCKSLTTLVNALSAGNGNNRLKKFRHYNWDTKNVTNFSGMFQYCRQLVDIDADFSGYITKKCTNMANMFANCNAIKEINLTNCDTSNVTAITGLFRECYNLLKVHGLEEFDLRKCAVSDNVFYYCYNFYQNDKGYLDLSKWHLSENAEASGNKSNLLCQCFNIKSVNIQNFSFDKTTSLSSLISHCRGVKSIDIRNILHKSTEILTNIANMFSQNYSLEEILYDGDGLFDGWNLSKVTNIQGIIQYSSNMKYFYFGTPSKSPEVAITSNNANYIIQNTQSLEIVDLSGLDFKNITMGITSLFIAGTKVKEFYPPKNINANFTLNFSQTFSKESLLRVIDSLYPQTSTKTLTLGSNKGRLTPEELAIATEKGWTVV
ncbi:MAG: BspA family leucine-rich repeat surface protein [Prevotellaceae bacterium]|nr:BspA family leucine-rich repeat surface protein [Candidatus Faecinaster equi]